MIDNETVAGGAVCRPRRRYRREQPRPMRLTNRDAAVVYRIFVSRFASAQSTYLFAREAAPDGGSDNWSKRLRALYDAGWLTRLYLPQSRYLAGSQWPIYCVETGVAALAAESRRRWADIDRATRTRYASVSSSTRDQLVALLTAEFGLSANEVLAGLRNATQHALKLYSGAPCHVPHYLLASSFCSMVWYAASCAGTPPAHIRPDGAMDLNQIAGGAAAYAVLPDMFFVVDQTAFCVEAETGSSSHSKIEGKIAKYLSLAATDIAGALSDELGQPVSDLRVVFHCATRSHMRLVAAAIASACPSGSSLFLVTDADTFHLDYSQLEFKRNLTLSTESDETLYAALAHLPYRALAMQVEGRDSRGAIVGYVPLLPRTTVS